MRQSINSPKSLSFVAWLWLVLGWLLVVTNKETTASTHPFGIITTRGGASTGTRSNEAFELLAEFVQDNTLEETYTKEKITKTIARLASSQGTFKGLDGAAHEAYQRTHAGDDIDTSVSGRAQRSASRLAATAEALLACELVELVQQPELVEHNETLTNRQVVLNLTGTEDDAIKLGDSNLAVLVLYEESYDGGAGLEHGSITALTEGRRREPRGRLLVIVGDELSGDDLVKAMAILNQKPQRVKLSSGLVTNEVASVQPTLYKTAGKLLTVLEPHLRNYSNTTAVHFVGRSLAGGVASLAATMLDGTIPISKSKKGKKKSGKAASKSLEAEEEEQSPAMDETNSTAKEDEEPVIEPLNGLGRARSSAMTLGAPPCLSSNVLAAFCTSIIYGDDVVCRTTNDSIDRLCARIQRSISGGFVGRNMGWMSDTLSLTVSSLKSHAHGSEGEEVKLSTPGRAYLVHPRRLGGICSIHEVGNMIKGGREALRANLLWQLHDVLLSKSMWKHHQLESYIHGLDRVQLRGSADEEESMY
jgi:hypothetical protein